MRHAIRWSLLPMFVCSCLSLIGGTIADSLPMCVTGAVGVTLCAVLSALVGAQ
jgi:hypothetical protein